MTAVITVPASLDDATFEHVLEQIAPLPADAKLFIDARHARWASPYGLTALLALADARTERPAFAGPTAEDTASYWARAGFYRHAERVFEMHGAAPRSRGGGDSSVLLEITSIARSEDVHDVVTRIQDRAQAILVHELNLDPRATMRFAMTLSEICQNIVEHAGRAGWVAVQTYNWQRRLGRRVVVIAVCDAGIGFRQSLETAHLRRQTDRWDDAMALEDAVIRGVSRFREPGRGRGLAGVRRYVGQWDGKMSVRSGTARIALLPTWSDDPPLEEHLPPFPGAQVQITIPERVAERPSERTAAPRAGAR